jgi:hypothetical protein
VLDHKIRAGPEPASAARAADLAGAAGSLLSHRASMTTDQEG